MYSLCLLHEHVHVYMFVNFVLSFADIMHHTVLMKLHVQCTCMYIQCIYMYIRYIVCPHRITEKD